MQNWFPNFGLQKGEPPPFAPEFGMGGGWGREGDPRPGALRNVACALGRFEQYCPGPSRCTVFNRTVAAFCMFLILPRFERDRSLAVVYHAVLNEIGGLAQKTFIFLGFLTHFGNALLGAPVIVMVSSIKKGWKNIVFY